MISKLDFIGIPSTDADRSPAFYVETSGLPPDAPVHPSEERLGGLRVDDVAAAREELEAKGVEFNGETIDTGVCQMALFPDGNDLVLRHRYAP